MAVQRPQHDLPNTLGQRLSGASDTWDNDLSGQLITADYFEAAAGAVTATLAATLADATLSASATVTPASAAVTATLAATLQDATLSATATVPVAPVAPSADVGGGGSSKSWKRKEYEAKALRDAIRKALGQVEEAVEVEAEAVAEVVAEAPKPSAVEVYTLPVAKDYSSEQAHLSALTAALDRVYAALPAIQARKASEIAEARAKREAKVAKVRKLLRMVDLLDAA